MNLGVFVIDSNNWKTFNDKIYGYKLDDLDNGLYFKLTKLTESLIISGSMFRPPLYLFKTENYFAISNSCYYLVKYLTQCGYRLTKNLGFNQYLNGNQYSKDFNSRITPYVQINIIPMFSEVNCSEKGVEINEFIPDLFTIPIEEAFPIIDNWHYRYNKLIQNILLEGSYVISDLSGGTDSRINFGFIQDYLPNNNIYVHSNKGKTFRDGTVGNSDLEIAKKVIQSSNISVTTECKLSIKSEESINYWLPYCWGSQGFKTFDLNNIENLTTVNLIYDSPSGFSYRFAGSGAELYKEFLNYKPFIDGWASRYIGTGHYSDYYLKKILTVHPFLDSQLLKIKVPQPKLLHAIIYLLYFPDLLKIPFTSGKGDEYFFDDKIIDEASRIISIYRNKIKY